MERVVKSLFGQFGKLEIDLCLPVAWIPNVATKYASYKPNPDAYGQFHHNNYI